MLKNQMERIEMMVGEQGLSSQNSIIAKAMEEKGRKEKEFDRFLAKTVKNKKNK